MSGVFEPAGMVDAGEICACINQLAQAMQAQGAIDVPSAAAMVDRELAGKLPDWIARFGLLKDGEQAWLYCEPRPDADPGSQGQLLLRLPPVRYWVDAFDLVSCACISRESAAGGPLVAGLPFTGHPVLLWIRPIAAER